MSKSDSGLFSGTKSNGVDSGSGTSGKVASSLYKATQALRDHIENPELTSSGSDGIKGAHHKENFLKEVDRIGAKTTGTTPNTQVDGVEQISYKMPKKDKYGNPTGEFKTKTFKKTVYDPSKIDTDTYIKWGLEAANNTARSSSSGKLGHEWTGIDNQGVKWHGYCDKNGEITSFYPED